MAGIYLHIPFCRQACHYCDFHFSTYTGSMEAMTTALLRELELRKDFLEGALVHTIYFGGGTPSLLPLTELEKILKQVQRDFNLAADVELTLEANPDDLTVQSLAGWKQLGINRLSIGIQSFREQDLLYMNRAHTAVEALQAIDRARSAGFRDLTIDLIYGTPTMNDEDWELNLQTLAELELPHFSAYALTVEPRTALASMVSSGKSPSPDDEQASRQFLRLLEWAREHDYEHYEISNFARPGRYSRHNTAYWEGISYLGIGPSAHSYDGRIRSWNIRNNPQYIRSVMDGTFSQESETLTDDQRYNEYILTRLRTQWGVELSKLDSLFGAAVTAHFNSMKKHFLAKGWLTETAEGVRLTDTGKLFADHIASELFL